MKESVPVYNDGDGKSLLVDNHIELRNRASTYNTFDDLDRTKSLVQLTGRARRGTIAKRKWAKLVTADIGNWTRRNAKERFIELQRKHVHQIAGKRAYSNQVKGTEEGMPYLGNMSHLEELEQLFEINEQLTLSDLDGEELSMTDMARKLIPKSLKPHARLRYIVKGGNEKAREKTPLK